MVEKPNEIAKKIKGEKNILIEGPTNSILFLRASLLKISVSSRGTSGTTSPANIYGIIDVTTLYRCWEGNRSQIHSINLQNDTNFK